MRFSLCLILFLGITYISYSQTNSYFIKYKNSVDISAVESKIINKNFSNAINSSNINNIEFKVESFAKNLGKDDENLSRIIKITPHQPLGKISSLQKNNLDNFFSNLPSNDNEIEYVQPVNIYKVDYVPNDSLISEQWALEKIQAFDAWDITQGENSIIIGIIDTGIDYLHPDLKNSIYINPGETGIDNFGNDKRFNGIDDDNNGFIDDYMGWDFTDRVGFPFDTTGGDYLTWDNNPMDDHGHGTAIAGIAGAESNNISGISGAAPKVKLLNLRAFDSGGFGEEDDVAAAILYAIKLGIKVINMSFGDKIFSLVLKDVIKYAYSQNVILVASSGNASNNLPHYPSGYSEVISVGNSTVEDYVAGNSSYGSTLDLVAPGSSILTTERNGKYSYVSGTSASAPFIAATAALLLSLQNFTNEEIKQIIKSTTDDINPPGWDDRSGAGRLNLFKALSVIAPAKIKINHPLQDFASADDLVKINVSAISPYFTKLDLLLGEGLNPDSWQTLVNNILNQVNNENIYDLHFDDLKEGTYTLRLIVTLTNGRTTEERVNFHVIRNAPVINLIGAGPVFYGDKSTILAEVETDQDAVVKLFYRKKGEGSFNFISLDGFATNNQFVKQFHYGFIPKQLISPNTTYEVYYEAENLAGLKTILYNNDLFFEYKTEPSFNLGSYTKLNFSLPKGTIFKEPVNFLSSNFNEILFNQFYETEDTIFYSLYQYQNEILNKNDSIGARFPKSFGDFNHNGKKDLLGTWERAGYIDEQISQNIFHLENKFKEENSSFFPIFAKDIDGDGNTEIISNASDKSFVVWRVNSNLSISLLDTLFNYSFIDSIDIELENANNVFNNIVIADLNGDNIKEIWFADSDGDLLSYKILGNDNFEKGDSLINYPYRLFGINKSVIDVGDYDGDGVQDLAILFESRRIANNYFLIIFNFKNNQFNLLLQKVFLDQSSEFAGFSFSEFYQSLKFVDVDNDLNDELILNVFPYAYIFKHYPSGDSPIFFSEGINTEFIYSGDINQNGVNEIALQNPEGYTFYEFGVQKKTVPPSFAYGYSIDSASIKLEWVSNSSKFYIYKGMNKNSIFLYDSTSELTYTDFSSIEENKNYYYRIQAYNNLFEEPFSELTNIIEVYSHKPAQVISAESFSKNSILINFSDRINNTIENLQSFEIDGVGYPNSVSAASQNSYLLTYKNDLPLGINQLIVKNLRDYYGSYIKEDTISFMVNEQENHEEFFITSHEIVNPYLIKIVFNYDVDETSASNLNNYSFEPANNISSAALDNSNKKILYLNLKNGNPVGSIGKEYKLKISNLFSSPSNGSLKINQGSGSYIVLSSFAENLSGVYVYPSPAKVNSGEGKLTFANLPQRAKITIWNLNGIQISSIEENDGNGGVDYNLRNYDGELLNSGVYIFRIVRLDNSDNEVEEKIGKFTVIR